MPLERTEQLAVLHYTFAAIYFVYFTVYYGRYSSLHQKITAVNKLRQTNVFSEQSINGTIDRTKRKIKKWRRICYFPPIGIALIHLITLLISFPKAGKELPLLLYLFIGEIILLVLANWVKGAQIFDPNRRFNSWRNHY